MEPRAMNLPPGFDLEQPSATEGSPNLPPGFEIEQPRGYMADVGHNAMEGLKEWPGAIRSVGEQVRKIAPGMMPGAIPTSAGEMIDGKPFSETPVGQTVEGVRGAVTNSVEAVPKILKGMGQTITHPFDSFRERPLGTAADLAAFAGGGISLAGKTAPALSVAAEDMAQNAARRSLGFTKRFLNKPGNLEKANETSRTMLNEGVIRNPITHPFSSGTESMLGRNDELMDAAGKKMGMTRQILDTHGIPGPNASESAGKVIQELNPRFADERRIADEISEDMKALGEDRLSYQDAFSVLKKLDQKAKFSPMGGPTEQLKANMYRQAYGIFRKELDQAVERGAITLGDFKGEMSKNYGKAKKLFGAGKTAEKALTNKLSSEEGNNRIGLRESMVAAGELAAGSPMKAVTVLAGTQAAKRFGNAGIATTANAAAKGLRMIPKAGMAKAAAVPALAEASGTRVLTEEKAREYLKRAKGDKNLARKLAKNDAYTWDGMP